MKHIDLLFTAPPTMDAPTYIGVLDDSGAEVKVGEWLTPDADNPFWRLRLSVAELVLQLVAPGTQMPVEITTNRHVRETPLLKDIDGYHSPLLDAPRSNPATDARKAMRDKVAGLKSKKETPTMPAPDANAPLQPGYKRCVDCGKPSSELQFQPCAQCGEDKCRTCIPDSDGMHVCLTCLALAASPEEGGFDAQAAKESLEDRRLRLAREKADQLDGSSSNPLEQRLFDGQHHPKSGSTDEGED